MLRFVLMPTPSRVFLARFSTNFSVRTFSKNPALYEKARISKFVVTVGKCNLG